MREDGSTLSQVGMLQFPLLPSSPLQRLVRVVSRKKTAQAQHAILSSDDHLLVTLRGKSDILQENREFRAPDRDSEARGAHREYRELAFAQPLESCRSIV